jgi:ATP phosphoribosyltransferase
MLMGVEMSSLIPARDRVGRSLDLDASQSLTIALPKGRLLPETQTLLARLGYDSTVVGNGTRKLIAPDPVATASYLLVKPIDVPTYVQYGAADVGIVGQDVLREAQSDVLEPLSLGYGHCRLVVAGRPEQRGLNLRLAPHLRIASKYPNLARDYFQQRGISVEVIPLQGSVELAPLVGLTDLLVDLVQTGGTLRANGLIELEEIARFEVALIVNRASQWIKRDPINRLIERLEEIGIDKASVEDVG